MRKEARFLLLMVLEVKFLWGELGWERNSSLMFLNLCRIFFGFHSNFKANFSLALCLPSFLSKEEVSDRLLELELKLVAFLIVVLIAVSVFFQSFHSQFIHLQLKVFFFFFFFFIWGHGLKLSSNMGKALKQPAFGN